MRGIDAYDGLDVAGTTVAVGDGRVCVAQHGSDWAAYNIATTKHDGGCTSGINRCGCEETHNGSGSTGSEEGICCTGGEMADIVSMEAVEVNGMVSERERGKDKDTCPSTSF